MCNIPLWLCWLFLYRTQHLAIRFFHYCWKISFYLFLCPTYVSLCDIWFLFLSLTNIPNILHHFFVYFCNTTFFLNIVLIYSFVLFITHLTFLKSLFMKSLKANFFLFLSYQNFQILLWLFWYQIQLFFFQFLILYSNNSIASPYFLYHLTLSFSYSL